MKTLLVIFGFGLLSFSTSGQKKPNLEFIHTELRPSQYIYREFFKLHQESLKDHTIGSLDSVCVFAFGSIKFTVTANARISNILPSVGIPVSLLERLKRAVKSSEGHWKNRKGEDIDCILPIMIFPASMCPDDRPFLMLQSGAQMLKYKGEYIIFPNTHFYDYNVDMAEGVILSPIMLHSGAIN